MTEYITTCGAERNITAETVSTFSEKPGNDTAITKVDGIPVEKDQPIGAYAIPSFNIPRLVGKCRRCVGNPNRKCDLSTSTWTELSPQS